MTSAALRISLVLAIAGAGVAHADPKAAAQAYIEQATEAYAAGKYTEAVHELTLAYALDPQPGLLFSIGQAHMKLGDCSNAITFYKRFLDSHPNERDAAIAQKAIFRCDAVKPIDKPAEATTEPAPATEPAKPVEQKPVEPPKPAAPAPEPPKPAPPPPEAGHAATSHPFYSDALGDVLVVTGVVAAAAGAYFYRSALSDRDAADHATSYQGTQDLVDHASSERTYAIVGAVAAGVLITGGIVHYVVHGGGHDEAAVAVTPTTHGGAVTWTHRF